MASKSDIHKLGTERRNRSAASLDTMGALAIARLINREDQRVPRAVRKALPQIAKAMDLIAKQLSAGGRMIYVGAGTSGRIAALDASELPPTFNTDPKMVQYVIAGGDSALGMAAEYNEDSEKLGERDIAKKKPTKKDVVVGIAASGRTALRAFTAGISNTSRPTAWTSWSRTAMRGTGCGCRARSCRPRCWKSSIMRMRSGSFPG